MFFVLFLFVYCILFGVNSCVCNSQSTLCSLLTLGCNYFNCHKMLHRFLVWIWNALEIRGNSTMSIFVCLRNNVFIPSILPPRKERNRSPVMTTLSSLWHRACENSEVCDRNRNVRKDVPNVLYVVFEHDSFALPLVD